MTITAIAELGRERQQLALALALVRVERQLHASKRPVRSARASSPNALAA